eukprot:5234316-Pleurochrysis_carterae.AAC.16
MMMRATNDISVPLSSCGVLAPKAGAFRRLETARASGCVQACAGASSARWSEAAMAAASSASSPAAATPPAARSESQRVVMQHFGERVAQAGQDPTGKSSEACATQVRATLAPSSSSQSTNARRCDVHALLARRSCMTGKASAR